MYGDTIWFISILYEILSTNKRNFYHNDVLIVSVQKTHYVRQTDCVVLVNCILPLLNKAFQIMICLPKQTNYFNCVVDSIMWDTSRFQTWEHKILVAVLVSNTVASLEMQHGNLCS